MNTKKPKSPRSGKLMLIAAALAAIVTLPAVGSAALSDGAFSIRAQNSDNPKISGEAGPVKFTETDPGETEPPKPLGEPDEIIYTINTTLEGCVTPGISFNAETTGSATIDWGDGSGANIAGIRNAHTYATPGEYKLKLKGKIKSIVSSNAMPTAPGAPNCFKSLDFWGPETGVTTISNAFEGANNLTYIAAPPSSVIYAGSLFLNAPRFNGEIGHWDTSNMQTMTGMFNGAAAFNRDISKWDTGKATSFSNMFNGAKAFNQDISKWNTSNVTNFSNTFKGATVFNQDISKWDTSKATTMNSMFLDAPAFSQNLTEWNVAKVTNKTNFAPLMSSANYPRFP